MAITRTPYNHTAKLLLDLSLADALQRLQQLERDSEDVMQLRAFVAARQRSIVR